MEKGKGEREDDKEGGGNGIVEKRKGKIWKRMGKDKKKIGKKVEVQEKGGDHSIIPNGTELNM